MPTETAAILGKPLTFETRLLAALALQIYKPSLDDLAEISGVKIVRYGERFRVDVERYDSKPIRIKVGKGITDARDILVDGVQYQVVMVDGTSGCVWAVPKGD